MSKGAKQMIALASDHAGFGLKNQIMEYLKKNGIEYLDYGCFDENRCDSADFAVHPCLAIQKGEAEKTILICVTGIGMSIIANKHDGIRAALCAEPFSAKHTRMHNDANLLCLGARVTGSGLALEIVDVFLNTAFLGGDYARRLEKLAAIERV